MQYLVLSPQNKYLIDNSVAQVPRSTIEAKGDADGLFKINDIHGSP